MLRRRRILTLWLARTVAAGSVILLLATLVLMAGSFVRAQVVTRWWWVLTSNHDHWSQAQLVISRGEMHFSYWRRTELAFVGPVVGEAPFALDRTDPQGITWSHETHPSRELERKAGDSPAWLAHVGLWWQTAHGTSDFAQQQSTAWWVRVSLLWPVAAAAALALLAGAAWRRAGRPFRRARAGLCTACGYDLRGSPGRCSECGGAR